MTLDEHLLRPAASAVGNAPCAHATGAWAPRRYRYTHPRCAPPARQTRGGSLPGLVPRRSPRRHHAKGPQWTGLRRPRLPAPKPPRSTHERHKGHHCSCAFGRCAFAWHTRAHPRTEARASEQNVRVWLVRSRVLYPFSPRLASKYPRIKGVKSPSITRSTSPISTFVRWSFTMRYGCKTYDRICDPKSLSNFESSCFLLISFFFSSSSSYSFDRNMLIARSLFLCCERSFWHAATNPVARWVIRTAESVVFTCCPPLPLER